MSGGLAGAAGMIATATRGGAARSLYEVTWQAEQIRERRRPSGVGGAGPAGTGRAAGVPVFADVATLAADGATARRAPLTVPAAVPGVAVPEAVRGGHQRCAGRAAVLARRRAAGRHEARGGDPGRGGQRGRRPGHRPRCRRRLGPAALGAVGAPGRIVLADVEGELTPRPSPCWPGSPSTCRSPAACRGARRAHPPAEAGAAGGRRADPPPGLWHLAPVAGGTLDGIAPVPATPAELGEDQVRVAVRAAGVNFRDVLIGLGMYPDPAAVMGSEGAGVVVESAPA
ncbi:hypothetical protein V2I01_30685 [Micromonospora sp. BRA006-A]|nr:hypothetical protein [Micromonospora sp. BRA006-A]